MALAAIAAGCSKSEVLNAPGAETPIAFETYSGRVPVTKAKSVVGEEGLAAAGGFQVYAFIHAETAQASYESTYMNKVVTGTPETTGEGDAAKTSIEWGYEGITYWPTTHQLDFVAYALNCRDNLKADEQDEYTKITYTVAEAVADQKDLLVATPVFNAVSTNNDGAVSLKFNHLLSRIGFSLITNEGNTVPVTIKDVTLTGSFAKSGAVVLNPKSGDGTASVPVITPAEAAEVTYDLLAEGHFTSTGSTDGVEIFDNSCLYEFKEGTTDFDDKYEAIAETEELKKTAAQNQANRYMMIIPTSAHNATLDVTYFLPEAGADFTVNDIDIKDIAFEPGKSYEFKFKVSTNTIGFVVEVEEWDTATGTIEEVITLS